MKHRHSSSAVVEARDGRHRRRERSRHSAVSAALALVREDGALPSIQRVADRAGLTERTVFNLFDDKTALVRAAVDAFRSEAIASLPELPPPGRLDARVRRFVDELASFLEDYSRVRWAALTSRTAVPDMERGVVLQALSNRVAALLESEGVDVRCDPSAVAALSGAVDPIVWRLYRVQQRLSVARAADAVALNLLALAARLKSERVAS